MIFSEPIARPYSPGLVHYTPLKPTASTKLRRQRPFSADKGRFRAPYPAIRGVNCKAVPFYWASSFSTAAFLAHTQKTSIASFSSSMGGYEGAMRRLLSLGSLP